jgi:hypothetical protein
VRYHHPKSEIHANGIYGGVGTRAEPEVWTPGRDGAPAEEERVPRRFRRLRLRRRRTSEREDVDVSSNFYFVLGVFIALALAATAWGIIRSFN